MLNVFEHQKFLLRRRSPTNPSGERVERSFRELMTLPDEHPMHFDYPIEYLNIAALNLCAALAQAVFEPTDCHELAARLCTPMTDEQFEAGIAPLRDLFTIDGPSGTRFLQGPEPLRDKKGRLNGSPLEVLLLTVKKGDKTFLNRPNKEWAVRPDQIPLLLFSRATFYEKSAGRGYLTGTSGDLEIRVFPSDPLSLRRTIWLNVLTRELQRERSGEYAEAGSGSGYDAWMWHQPPAEDVPEGAIALRSGLFWMVANAYIELQEVQEPRLCIITGEPIQGQVGTSAVIQSTGRGYGIVVAREKGPAVRQSFFLHPNGPVRIGTTKDNQLYKRHLSVEGTAGVIGHMGGLFFAGSSGSGSFKLAPVVEQLSALQFTRWYSGTVRPSLDLLCFGFHMLSSKQNVHGGYEYESFHYPLLDVPDKDIAALAAEAQSLLESYATDAREIESLLGSAVQRCMLVQMDTTEDDEGRLSFKPKKNLPLEGILPGIGKEYWRSVGVDLRTLLGMIETHGTSEDALQSHRDALEAWWRSHSARHAIRLFETIFSSYATSPTHIAAAHKAKGYLYGTLRKKFGVDLTHSPEP